LAGAEHAWTPHPTLEDLAKPRGCSKFSIGIISEEAFETGPKKKDGQSKSTKASEKQEYEIPAKPEVRMFQDRIRASYHGAKLDGAALPPYVSDFLKKGGSAQDEYNFVFWGLFNESNDPDPGCTPRAK